MFKKYNEDEHWAGQTIRNHRLHSSLVIRCDLWSLQMEAVRDAGYCKATLGHNLLIKIFPKLDHVLMESARSPFINFMRPEHPCPGRFPHKGPSGGTLYKQTGPSRLEVQITLFSSTVQPKFAAPNNIPVPDNLF